MAAARSLLLVVEPGPLADGLLAVLASTPGLEVCGRVDSLGASSNHWARPAPSEVLLDAGSHDLDLAATIALIRSLWPGTKCLVLADDVAQHRAAQRAGADAVLLKGCKPSELVLTVESLIQA